MLFQRPGNRLGYSTALNVRFRLFPASQTAYIEDCTFELKVVVPFGVRAVQLIYTRDAITLTFTFGARACGAWNPRECFAMSCPWISHVIQHRCTATSCNDLQGLDGEKQGDASGHKEYTVD